MTTSSFLRSWHFSFEVKNKKLGLVNSTFIYSLNLKYVLENTSKFPNSGNTNVRMGASVFGRLEGGTFRINSRNEAGRNGDPSVRRRLAGYPHTAGPPLGRLVPTCGQGVAVPPQSPAK